MNVSYGWHSMRLERKKDTEMELGQPFLLEELVALRRENWSTYPTEVMMNDLYTNGWSCDFIDESPVLAASNDVPMGTGFSMPLQMEQYFDVPFSEMHNTLDDVNNFVAPETVVLDQFNLPYETENCIMPLQQPNQDQYTSMVDEEFTFLSNGVQHMEEEMCGGCKVEMVSVSSPKENLASSKSSGGTNNKDRRNGVKKVTGQPSKNLMAERRRRKRLNDRLSMLRSIVPRISKMDRTSILADTIDYMKELMEKVSKLEEGEADEDQSGAGAINKLKQLRSNEGQTENSPKFEVRLGERDTRIDICCTPRPGLLISTVNTLEALGLEIQQCVISCFNDFSMQAACSQVSAEQAAMTADEIKQTLFRNTGYDGKCL